MNIINKIKEILADGYFGYYEDGCLCGLYEFVVPDFGVIVVETSCRKASGCPVGKDWHVHNEVKVFNKLIGYSFGYVPSEEECGDEYICLQNLDRMTSEAIIQLVRENIIAHHSSYHLNEYGEEENPIVV